MCQELPDMLSFENKTADKSMSSKSLNDIETKKQPWTKEEDVKLLEVITVHGPQEWSKIAKQIPGCRTGKQCHSRWTSCLNPDNKKGDWKPEEDNIILELVHLIGTKWSKVNVPLNETLNKIIFIL